MKVAALQHDVVWEDAPATQRHLEPMIAGAAGTGARLIVLTEMFGTGFTMRPQEIAEPVNGASTEFLHAQAAKHGVWLCGSIPTRADDLPKAVNRLVLVSPHGEQWHYDKIHPFTYGGEAEHYQGGTSFLTLDIEGMRTSFFVCYDLRFADEFWQLAATTDCFVIPANWPEVRRHHWHCSSLEPSKTRLTSLGSTASAKAASWPIAATHASSIRSAKSSLQALEPKQR
jgi:predicted amidohydrolase